MVSTVNYSSKTKKHKTREIKGEKAMLDLNEQLEKITKELKKENEEISKNFQAMEEEKKDKIIVEIMKIRENLISKIGYIEELGFGWYEFNLRNIEHPFGRFANIFYINKKEKCTYPWQHFGIKYNCHEDEINEELFKQKSYGWTLDVCNFLVNVVVPKVNGFVTKYIEDYAKEIERKKKELEEYKKGGAK